MNLSWFGDPKEAAEKIRKVMRDVSEKEADEGQMRRQGSRGTRRPHGGTERHQEAEGEGVIVAMIEGTNVTLGKKQGYIPLPVRIEMVEAEPMGRAVTMVSAWTPTPDELAAIAAGANIHVRLFCVEHPPIIVSVGPLPGVLVFKEGIPA